MSLIAQKKAAQAHARYPTEDLLLAIVFFESDQRVAGLGSLDSRRRRQDNNRKIVRIKQVTWQGDIEYVLSHSEHARRAYESHDLAPVDPIRDRAVHFVVKPPFCRNILVRVTRYEMTFDRTSVAMKLMSARAALRRDVNQLM